MTSKNWSTAWKSSVKKNKKIKYMLNAPLHIKSHFLNAHLSKNLRNKQKKRALRVRKGDLVKIMRGEFRGKEGKVHSVNLKLQKVYVENIERTKKDGSKALVPFKASKLLIQELSPDKKRL